MIYLRFNDYSYYCLHKPIPVEVGKVNRLEIRNRDCNEIIGSYLFKISDDRNDMCIDSGSLHAPYFWSAIEKRDSLNCHSIYCDSSDYLRLIFVTISDTINDTQYELTFKLKP